MGTFRNDVEALVVKIPEGKVMTYGQVAAMCGKPRAARLVGGIAHFSDPSLPWKRVVNKQGEVASGYPGGKIAQKKHLEAEGVDFTGEFTVDMEKHWL